MARLYVARLGQEPQRLGKPGVYIPPTVRQVHLTQECLKRDYGHRAKDIPVVLNELDLVLQGEHRINDPAFNAIVRLTLHNRPINGTQSVH